MVQLITFIHILVAASLIVLVLMQHGKGADAGAAFGSGSSNTMFGSSGSTSFLMKLTAVFATIFFITSLSLSVFAVRAERHNATNSIANSLTQQPIPVSSTPSSTSAPVKTTTPPTTP